MKHYLVFAVIVSFLILSCKKYHNIASIPTGIWVDKARPLDTLVTYGENGKNILFDNSEMFRSVSGRLSSDEYYRWKYTLTPGRINIKNYPQAVEDYQSYEFNWTIEGKEFSMQANAIRPYLNSFGTRLVYVKVK